MAWGRSSADEPSGYRRAKDGESADMTLNGIKYVHSKPSRTEAHNPDDGKFDKGDVGDKHYEDTFNPDKRAAAKKNLANAEDGAAASGAAGGSSMASKLGANINGQRAQEENTSAASHFKNAVTGKGGLAGGKTKGKGVFKKAAPIITIVAALCGFGSMTSLTQAFMPFSLISQFQGNFDSIGTSTTLRTKSWLKMQMDGGRVKGCTKAKIFGGQKFKISNRQKTKLAKSGIDVEVDANGNTVMKFTDYDGTVKTVTADEFEGMYNSNEKFRSEYYEGSRTWRGAVHDWFDSMATKFLSWFGIQRNNFADFRKTTDPEADQEKFRSKVEDVADNDGVNAKTKSVAGQDETEVEDPNTGQTSTDPEHQIATQEDDLNLSRTDVDVDSNGKITSTQKLGQKLEAFANSKLSKMSSTISALANTACGVLNIMGAIGLIVAAYQAAQIVKTAATLFEGIQKGQIDDSNTAPLNEIANSLTMKAKHTYYDDNQNEIATREKSAMEANAVSALYGNIATDPNDVSVKSFNVMSVLGSLNVGIESFKACTYAKLAAAFAGAVMDAVEIAACILSVGIGCLVSMATDAAIAAGIGLAVTAAVSIFVPKIAQILTRRIATEVMGEDLGNALVSGANMYMGSNHQYSGGSVATKETLTRYITARDQVIADKARYERENLSPFDMSSQYTFLGSLLTSLIPLTLQTSTIAGGVTTFANTVTHSLSSLMPGASAVSAAVTAQAAADQTRDNCVYLDSIGAVGDAFCNPYFITDLDTINSDPADEVNTVDSYGGFEDGDDTDVPKIKQNSQLARFIVFCGQRQSPFGMPDNNIASEVTSNVSTGSSAGDSIVGAIPIIGDTLDIISNSETLDYYGYISGEACVTGSSGDGAKVPDWGESKHYQRFIEDQRLAENMGLVEKSSVSAFLDEYYQEHPLDNSYEGILARRSGLTKEQVSTTLDAMEVIAFLQDYDPSNMYPLAHEEKKEEKIYFEDKNINTNSFLATLINRIEPDKRIIRNFALA